MVATRIKHKRFIACFRKWCVRFCLVVYSGCFAVVVQWCSEEIAAQESRNWMIPGTVARGLSERRTETTFVERKRSWMADVDELDWHYIIVHHSATESGSIESIHEQHLKRRDASGNPWLGIGYHFLIGNGHGMKDGTVQATFRWKEQIHGAHSGHPLLNSRGIGICVIGNFEDAPPSKAQLESLKSLVKALAVRHRIMPENFMGHGSVRATACPGKRFPLNEIRQAIFATNS